MTQEMTWRFNFSSRYLVILLSKSTQCLNNVISGENSKNYLRITPQRIKEIWHLMLGMVNTEAIKYIMCVIKHSLKGVVDNLSAEHSVAHCTADCQLVSTVGVLLYEHTMSLVSHYAHHVILISIMYLHA
jgi:hypothetical protein